MARFLLLVGGFVLLGPLLSQAQIRRDYHVTFDTRPPYWAWIDPYHDANLDRVFENGAVRYTMRTDNYNWSLYGLAIDPLQPWEIQTSVTIHGGKPTNGPGIVILCGDVRYYFIIGTDRNYWMGSTYVPTNKWSTLNTYSNNQYNPPCECVNPTGTPNTIVVRYDGKEFQMVINGKTVQSIHPNADWKALLTNITEVGILAAGRTDASFDSFSISYTEKKLPIVPDAFVGAVKQYVDEFEAPGSRYPVLAPNGKQIYYVTSGPDNSIRDDIMFSEAITDSTWTQGKKLGPPLNNVDHNNVISVSQDGNELMVYGTYTASADHSSHGFSTSRRTATGWSVPVAITTAIENGVAPTREECLAPDGSVLIVSRDIPGKTYGGKDMYVSIKQPDGSFGSLINLGANVNSDKGDGMMYLAADGRTLYFASSNDSYGNEDIFVTKRLDDSWTNWTKRINLGPTINTPGWDGYFCIHPSGKWAYMNSSDGYKSGIVRVSLPSDAASRDLLPDPVLIVEGNVYDSKTKSPLSVAIDYSDLASGKKIGSAISEPARGSYSIVLTGGRNYGFNAVLQGYFPVGENLNLDTLSAYRVIKRDLYLVPIEKNAVIRLNNLFFDTDKWDLRPESTGELARLILLLQQNPSMQIQISGHTDDRGSSAHNQTLSTNRANSVLTYLTNNGIPKNRLSANGYGKSKPIAAGTTDEARQQNRRVEFTIVSM